MSAQLQQDLPIGHQSQPELLATVPPGWLDELPGAAACLRDYQREQVRDVAAAMRNGHRRILVQGATGSGKTHVIATIALAAFRAGIRVLILATRTRLVRQLHERLIAFGTPHGVIAAPLPHLRNYSAAVQVAGVDTLHRRAVVTERIPMPSADVVIFDEAHLSTADTRLRILDRYAGAVRVGFTATPARKSGRSLGAAFDVLIRGRSIRELTAAGVLVPTRIWNTPLVTTKELRSVPKEGGDYQPHALGELLSRPKLIGDVLENWLRIAKGKRTLIFAVTKTHAAALLADFLRNGIRAEMLTDQDGEATREEVVGRLESGATHVVISCFLLGYGADIPSVECIVLARPTRSLVMFLQMVGRGLRPSPATGKVDCTLIDHGRVVETLGLPQSDFDWTLEAGRNANAEAAANNARAAAEAMRTCRQCQAIWLTSEAGNACPVCGWTAPSRAKRVEVEDADLEELADAIERPTPRDQIVIGFYQAACGYFARRNPDKWREKCKSVRWRSWCETRAKFGFEESAKKPGFYWDLEPIAPSTEIAGWLKYREIKFARARAKAAA